MLISQSGGLLYHAKAFRYQKSIWSPFRSEVEHWLRTSWSPDRSRPLILIGSSAGWCLPLDFLREFRSIAAYDPDPFALWLLKRRLNHPGLRTHTQDALGIRNLPPAGPLRQILEDPAHQGASILFCNLWGQLHFEEGLESCIPRWRRELETLLEGRNWASFFDRVSGSEKPEITERNRSSSSSLSDTEIIARYYARTRDSARGTIELQDHGTESYFRELPRQHLNWELRPGRYHLIEAIARKTE